MEEEADAFAVLVGVVVEVEEADSALVVPAGVGLVGVGVAEVDSVLAVLAGVAEVVEEAGLVGVEDSGSLVDLVEVAGAWAGLVHGLALWRLLLDRLTLLRLTRHLCSLYLSSDIAHAQCQRHYYHQDGS